MDCHPLPTVNRFLIGVAFAATSLSATAADFVVVPTEITVNSSGTEAIIDVEADFGGGVLETATIHIDGSVVNINATSNLPDASDELFLSYDPCTPNPLTGICELDPFAPPQNNVYFPPSNSNIEGIWVAPLVCAAAYAVAYGINVHACKDNGGISAQEIGACGVFGGSSVTCNDPDDSPPDEPEIPDEPEPPTPPSPPPGTPPDCTAAGCGDFWNWARGSLNGCLSHNPAACY